MSTIRKIVFGVSLIGAVTAFGLAFAMSGDTYDPALPLLDQVLDFLIALGVGFVFVIIAFACRPKRSPFSLDDEHSEVERYGTEMPSMESLTDLHLGAASTTNPVSNYHAQSRGLPPYD